MSETAEAKENVGTKENGEKKETTIKKDAAIKKEYKLKSATGTYMTFIGGGRIFNNVIMDDEKITIVTKPAKKSTIPVLYYEDITNIMVQTKITGYAVFWIVIALLACFAEPGCIIFVPLFIWGGLNRKIIISLRSGNQAIVYSKSKKIMQEFVADVKKAAKIS